MRISPGRRLDPARAGAVRDGLGVGLAVGLSGLAFGTTAVTSGLSVAQACTLSLIAFTGASQFALVGVVAGGGNLVAGSVGALLLGGRNALYGLRLSGLLGLRGRRKVAGAQFVIDETTAVSLAQPDPASARTGFFTTAIALYLTWNLTTFAGAVGADGIGDPATFGLDAVGPAVFLALLWPQLRGSRARLRVALGGAAIALLATPMLPPGLPVLLAAAAALLAGHLPPEDEPATDGTADPATGGHATDTHAADTHATDTHATDTHATDTHATDTHATDTHATDTQAADTHAADTHAAGGPGRDAVGPAGDAAESQGDGAGGGR